MKGQATVEFFIMISLMLLVSAIFMLSGFSIQERLLYVKLSRDAQKIVDDVAFEINSALEAGNGYVRNFYIEEEFGYDYTLSIEGYSVIMDWDDKSSAARILTDTINGDLEKGWNVIKNVDGVIYIE